MRSFEFKRIRENTTSGFVQQRMDNDIDCNCFFQIIIKGERRAEGDFGFESSSFSRTYPLPDGVDPQSITTKTTSGGSMTIEATKLEPKPVERSADTVITVRSGSSQSVGDVANINDKMFNVILNVTGYSAADIKVKVRETGDH